MATMTDRRRVQLLLVFFCCCSFALANFVSLRTENKRSTSGRSTTGVCKQFDGIRERERENNLKFVDWVFSGLQQEQAVKTRRPSVVVAVVFNWRLFTSRLNHLNQQKSSDVALLCVFANRHLDLRKEHLAHNNIVDVFNKSHGKTVIDTFNADWHCFEKFATSSN